ncbi:MAG: hypothetical protein JOS17DRAFT_779749 [Linnemannia elongata]|nr:MAG: hypothetical protein JOS17DRAFT_779749 [Linnemannia elongata]
MADHPTFSASARDWEALLRHHPYLPRHPSGLAYGADLRYQLDMDQLRYGRILLTKVDDIQQGITTKDDGSIRCSYMSPRSHINLFETINITILSVRRVTYVPETSLNDNFVNITEQICWMQSVRQSHFRQHKGTFNSSQTSIQESSGQLLYQLFFNNKTGDILLGTFVTDGNNHRLLAYIFRGRIPSNVKRHWKASHWTDSRAYVDPGLSAMGLLDLGLGNTRCPPFRILCFQQSSRTSGPLKDIYLT